MDTNERSHDRLRQSEDNQIRQPKFLPQRDKVLQSVESLAVGVDKDGKR